MPNKPRTIRFQKNIPPDFYWLNEPQTHMLSNGLRIKTDPQTDFWQRTHYGFTPDNGHCLLTKVSGDVAVTTRVTFDYRYQYDQSGLFLRLDSQNWIKMSLEYEHPGFTRLGAVVTNLGYSDWATTDLTEDIRRMWFRMQTHGQDYLLESSFDGQEWQQMRIGHMHHPMDAYDIGIYACSPKEGDGFWCTFDEILIGESNW